MAKLKLTIEMEITYDELQYEQDGFIGPKDVSEVFKQLFPLNEKLTSGFDFEYEVKKIDFTTSDYESELSNSQIDGK